MKKKIFQDHFHSMWKAFKNSSSIFRILMIQSIFILFPQKIKNKRTSNDEGQLKDKMSH